MIEDIRYLIVFAKIAEIGSISKGAKALGLSSATASQHLTKLEKNLGCALFYRNTRKITLTHDGEKLLETAKSILETYEQGINDLRKSSIIRSKKLNISIPAIFIHGSFMKHITDFIKDFPDLIINITCDDEKNDLVFENIDVAFRIGEPLDSSLKSKYLFDIPRSIVATKNYLKTHEEPQTPYDLETMSWIGLSMRPHSRILRNKNNADEVKITYNPSVCVNNVEASYQLAKLDVGLAAPPNYLIKNDIISGDIVKVLPQWELQPLNVYAIWQANLPINSIAYLLINKIYSSFESKNAKYHIYRNEY
ncbi:LysR family transcriptional regulator [Acinetobacter haemolyticus]|uniref:LysR family transcriptional regulator n=1 Tax=Acinetobacter haemolyticus TaxID=29430 RepID=UPI002A69EE72|nr:LysR family transcriptional regulator [Acinetobacter haemolyticus]WPO67485.1 LysR family transcriptional regulator [Acinetobacter haemolyticus]